MEKKIKILIEIKNGMIRNLMSNSDDVMYVIVDYDLPENGDKPVSPILEPDFVSDNLRDAFTDTDEETVEIWDELKRLKF